MIHYCVTIRLNLLKKWHTIWFVFEICTLLSWYFVRLSSNLTNLQITWLKHQVLEYTGVAFYVDDTYSCKKCVNSENRVNTGNHGKNENIFFRKLRLNSENRIKSRSNSKKPRKERLQCTYLRHFSSLRNASKISNFSILSWTKKFILIGKSFFWKKLSFQKYIVWCLRRNPCWPCWI